MSTSLLRVSLARPPVAIIGVGNTLMHDDAFGPEIIRALEAAGSFAAMADRVELVDAGTAGFDLMHQLLGREQVILLDAVAPRHNEPPGTVCVFEHDELLAMSHRSGRGTPHEPSILAAIQVAELAGELPHLTLIGVVPSDVSIGVGMSEAVRGACAAVEAAVATAVNGVTAPSKRRQA